MGVSAENLAHHVDQLQCAAVANPVKDPVGILAGIENALVAQYCQMLGDVALRRTDFGNNVVDTYFIIAQGT